ncbi:MAG: hypothetical protein LH702_08555 [Phormidesmis sp. CAN_BIN44]|nr:hypothetical protein [Phormidesmis sp. CAN_BIN44]
MIHQIGELGDAIIELQQEAIGGQILDFEKPTQGTLIESITQKLLTTY